MSETGPISDGAPDGAAAAPDGPVTLVDLLDQLVEAPMPAPIPLAPQTAGWAVLAALLLLALGALVWRAVARYRANAYRRAALRALAAAGEDPAAMAAILRRAALAAFPRADVAGLTGARWLGFLRETGGFPEAAGALLLSAPYRPAGSDETYAPLRQGVAVWLRQHRRPT